MADCQNQVFRMHLKLKHMESLFAVFIKIKEGKCIDMIVKSVKFDIKKLIP